MLIWLATWTLGFFLPAFAAMLLHERGISFRSAIVIVSVIQLGMAAGSWFLLQRSLEQRRFVVATS
jgi:hypothetical protein